MKTKTLARWMTLLLLVATGALWAGASTEAMSAPSSRDLLGPSRPDRLDQSGVECITVGMQADASVSSLQARQNFGSEQTLLVGSSGADTTPSPGTPDPEEPTATPAPGREVWQALLKPALDESFCPPLCPSGSGSSIISATLSVHMVDSTGRTRDLEACPIDSPWFEQGVTWDNRPRFEESECQTWAMDPAAGRYGLDVTDRVAAWVEADADTPSWLLRSRDPRDDWLRIFRSREWRTEDEQPQLEVCYEPPPDVPAIPRPTIRPIPILPTGLLIDQQLEPVLNPPTGCGPISKHPPLIGLAGGRGGCSPCCAAAVATGDAGGGTGFPPTLVPPAASRVDTSTSRDTGIAWGSGAGVYLHSGEAYLSEVDLEIPGRGFDFRMERKYRSALRYEGPLGAGWSTSYERRLVLDPDPSRSRDVSLVDGTGRVDDYVRQADGSFAAPVGYFTSLTEEADGSFVERDAQGFTVTYGPPGEAGWSPMRSLSDRHGNTMRFEHDGQGRLARVIDTLGRSVDYAYDEQGRIRSVEDFAGRRVTYAYDDQGNLASVTSPAITGMPNGNDFPEGRTWRYTYSSGTGDARLDHNLLSATAPNEVAAGGPPMLQLSYNAEDRVVAMAIGGTNASGIPAGGTLRYIYESLELPAEIEVNTPVRQTVVEDRNGNRTRYQMNRLGNIVARVEETNRDIRPDDPDAFTTRYAYSAEGHLLRTILPEGNWSESTYDLENPDRLQQGNLLAQSVHADPDRGGDQSRLTSSYRYEPVFGKVHALTDPRGHDADYRPQIALPGETYPNPERYTTIYTYDYQEGEDYAALGRARGLGPAQMQAVLVAAGIPMGLGDVNGDGRTDGVAGDLIRIEHPSVQLAAGSRMAGIEGDRGQERIERFAYNDRGQLTWLEDAEGHITLYTYHPENDPDGDGENRTPGMSEAPAGYLASVIRDAGATPPPIDRPAIYLPYLNNQSSGGFFAQARRWMGSLRGEPQPDASPLSSARVQGIAQGDGDDAAGHANITTRYTYDPVGHLERFVDPRGVATDYTVNALGEVVQILRAADVSGALANPEEPDWSRCDDVSLPECRAGMVPFGYRTLLTYDANGNPVRREVENRDTVDDARLGAFVQTDFSYDILDQLVETRQEVSESPAEELVTRYRYDANGNRVLVLSPLANLPEDDPEARPSHVLSIVYDERDLLSSATRGGVTTQFASFEAHAGIPERSSVPSSPDRATETYRVDANGNRVAVTDAADNSGDGQPETSMAIYDGFDRPVSQIDALGGQSLAEYDPASQIVARSDYGPTGGESPTDASAATITGPLDRSRMAQPLLARFEVDYDEAGRQLARRDMLFAYEDVSYQRQPFLAEGTDDQPGDGWVEVRYEYDRAGRLRFATRDDGATSMVEYDGADRPVRAVDAEGNQRLTAYDDAGNLVRITHVERSRAAEVAAGSVPEIEQRYTRAVVYDALNRAIRTSDALGQSIRTSYDSRDNIAQATDAMYSQQASDQIPDPLGLVAGGTRINRPGNRTTTEHDGLDRVLRQVADLRQDGQGASPLDTSNPANPDGKVALETVWDAGGRIVARTDDSGQTTRYAYDDLDRVVRRTLADGSVYESGYDLDGNLRSFRDPNGSQQALTVDGLGRLVEVAITPGEGLAGTVLQSRQYDGLSRLRLATDENEPENAADDVTVELAYDSLGRQLEERQGSLAVSSRWSGAGDRLELVYPNGRQLRYTHDAQGQIDTILEFTGGQDRLLADYDRLGGRLLERRLANGTVWTQLSDARDQAEGYDALGRLTRLRHLGPEGELLAGFDYDYSRANRPTAEDKLHDPSRGERYPFDSLGRLVGFERGQLDPTSSSVLLPAPDGLQDQTWQLDGAGNWAATSRTVDGASAQETRAHNAIHAVERIGDSDLSYDANGNLTDDGRQRYVWDALGRLREVRRSSDDERVAVYAYDALGRRAAKLVFGSGELNGTYRFYQDGARVLEERDETGRLRRQHVYGQWLDEPLAMDTDLDGDGIVTGAADRRVYFHHNHQSSVMALSDAEGRLVEGYHYDPFGRPTIFRPGANGSLDWGGDDDILPGGASAYGNPYLYTGRRWEPETGLYYYRARYLDPSQGRFISQDPLGAWGTANLGSAYAYVGNRPQAAIDPSGMKPGDPIGSIVVIIEYPPPAGTMAVKGGDGGMGVGFPPKAESIGGDTGGVAVMGPGKGIKSVVVVIEYYPPGGTMAVKGGDGGGGVKIMGRYEWAYANIVVSSIGPAGPSSPAPCPPIGPLPPGKSIDEEGLSTKFVGSGGSAFGAGSKLGAGQGGDVSPMKCNVDQKEIDDCKADGGTLVVNANCQTFCYKPLKPDTIILDTISSPDPPLVWR